MNDWMKTYAAANGHVYLDYWTATVDAQGMLKTELSEDDLHPNAAGYAIMAPLAEAAIAKALNAEVDLSKRSHAARSEADPAATSRHDASRSRRRRAAGTDRGS